MKKSFLPPLSLACMVVLLGVGCVKKSGPQGGHRGPGGGGDSNYDYCSDPIHANTDFCKSTHGKTVGVLGDKSHIAVKLSVAGSPILTKEGSDLKMDNQAGWKAGWQVPLPLNYSKVDAFVQYYYPVNANGKPLPVIRAFFDQDGKKIIDDYFVADINLEPNTGFISEGSPLPSLIDAYPKLTQLYEVIYFGDKVFDRTAKEEDADYYYVMPIMHITVSGDSSSVPPAF